MTDYLKKDGALLHPEETMIFPRCDVVKAEIPPAERI